MTNPLEMKKGPMGYLNDARNAMARVHSASGDWLKAYDLGDTASLDVCAEIMGEAMGDLQTALQTFCEMSKEGRTG